MDTDQLYAVIGRQAVMLMERNGQIAQLQARIDALLHDAEAKDGCACEPAEETPDGD